MKRIFLISVFLTSSFTYVNAQKGGNPKDTEAWSPVPKVVELKSATTEIQQAPSDAIILFDGKNLDQWLSVNDKSAAKWTVKDNSFTVKKGTGNIQTKQSFTNYQLHIEWLIPADISGSGQGRGNSGIFLASTGPGDDGYEIQVLDSYKNAT
jgi:hypothetical protein